MCVAVIFGFLAGGKYLLPVERILNAMGQFHGCDFLVFSDEADWCRKFIRGPEVAYSPFSTAIEDLFAMSICDHHANRRELVRMVGCLVES
jgi:hypothetical protein